MGRRDPSELILGLRALRERLVAEADLIAAFSVWEADAEGGRSLAEILVDQGGLDPVTFDRLSRHDATLTQDGSATTAHEWGGSAAPDGPPAAASIRYRVVRPHARGGLGEVFSAIDLELDRRVALKELQPRFAHDAMSQARFLREAEITGRLEHPGIVPVYGLGRHADGRPYYAMRFVEGQTFRAAVDRFHRADPRDPRPEDRDLAFRRLLRSVVEASYAVGYAHSRGVVHRDLKPENIMLGRFGETLVVDWGLARDLGAAEPPEAAVDDAAAEPPVAGDWPFMTRPGAAVGTPAYMSPEQAAGDHDRIGPAADVYSLGATLYCLLVGHPPFTGASAAEVLTRVRSGVFPSPRRLRRTVDPALEAICLKAMATRPEDRYATTLELAEALETWLAEVRYQDEQQSAMELVRDSRARFALERASSFLGRGRAGEGMVWLARAMEHGAPSLERGLRLSLAAWHARDRLLERTLPLAGPVDALRFSPDGKRLAAAGRNGVVVIWDVASGTHLGDPLVHPEGLAAVVFSTDGRTIAAARTDGVVQLWDGLSGAAVGPPANLGGPILDLQPVGSRFLAVSAVSIVWIDDRGADPRPIPPPTADRLAAAAIARDVVTVATEPGDVWRLDPEADGWRPLPRLHPLGAALVAVHPGDGRLLAVGRDGAARLDLGGSAPPSALALSDGEETVWAGFSPSGETVATLSRQGDARLWDAATGAALGETPPHRSSAAAVVFHPDGAMLATGCLDGSARLWDAAAGLPLGPPLSSPSCSSAVEALTFSPDGRRLAVSTGDGRLRFWATPAPLPGTVERIACWVRVAVDLDIDSADAVRPLEPLAGWELRRRLYELGGPPVK